MNYKKIAVSAAVTVAMVAPMAALAATSGSEILGLNYATAIGLGTKDVRTTISGVIKAFMGLLGIVAVIIILLGGFRWMTSGGEEAKVGEAKKLLISGIIGLIIIMMAYAIANFVVEAIVTGTN